MATALGRDHIWFEGTGAAGARPPADDGWRGAIPPDDDRDLRDIPMIVRPFGIRDLARLRGLDVVHAVSQPEALVLGNHPLRNAARSALPGQRGRRPAFIAESGERIIGYAGFRSNAPDGRWMLHALGASVGVYAAEPVWERILEYAVRQAGLRGVRTLYARIPWGVGAGPPLARAGWTAYATETVFQAPDARVSGGRRFLPRPQEAADTWAVHQLYCAVTPRTVQTAEAFTSRRWEIPAARGRRVSPVAGLVFEQDGLVVAYARALRGDRSRSVELMVHPEYRSVTGDAIDGTLFALGSRGARRTWWTIRGYQSELSGPLQERGFSAAFEQELLVRYTTAVVKRAAVESAHFTLDVRERVPSRVPTFLRNTSEDRSAG